MVDGTDELKDRTVWRKYLTYTKDENSFMGESKYAGVFCVREVTGYAIWYRRYLGDVAPEGRAQLNGSYLLRFYAPSAKHEAIAFAVQVTSPGEDAGVALAHLDGLAMDSPFLCQASDTTGPFERIN